MNAKHHDAIRNIIIKWIDKNFNNIKYDKFYRNFEFSFEVYGRHIYIYSNRPGILIGKAGCYMYELEEMLKEEGIYKKVDFVETGSLRYPREISVRRKFL